MRFKSRRTESLFGNTLGMLCGSMRMTHSHWINVPGRIRLANSRGRPACCNQSVKVKNSLYCLSPEAALFVWC
jgi:hypothetical protein